MGNEELTFLCDRMLGKLCRWLRFLGFDSSFTPDIKDRLIIQIAHRENRILLTRDKGISRMNLMNIGFMLIHAVDLESQLAEVNKKYDLIQNAVKNDTILNRCSICNNILIEAEKKVVKKGVPEGIFSVENNFWHCGKCNKYYWPGSHYEEILKKIETLK